MQSHSALEDKLRRSTSLLPHDLYKSFMTYASSVRDAQEVYSHMEQNQIGINEPLFWLARLQIMKQRCQFVQIVKMLQKIAQNNELAQHKDYYLLTLFKNKLDKEMLDFTRSKYRGRRKAQQFEIFSMSSILREKRIIGGSLVYVDPECRMNYLLEDYSRFIAENFKQHIEEERNHYDRAQEGKPYSFISKRTQSLEELADELIAKQHIQANRKSMRMSTNNKITIIENCQTPKHIKLRQSQRPRASEKPRVSEKQLVNEKPYQDLVNDKQLPSHENPQRHRDSVEILKAIRASFHQGNDSPTFGVLSNSKVYIPRQSISRQPHSPIERARPQHPVQDLAFSFGRQDDKTQLKHNEQSDDRININNNAFIFQSFSNSSKSSCKQIVKKEDFQLQLIIKQTQREHYEQQSKHRSQSRRQNQSDLDSNQQNYQIDTLFDDRVSLPKRKPFQILYKREDNHHGNDGNTDVLQNRNDFVIDLSHLLEMNDEEQRENQQNSTNEQYQIVISTESSNKQRKPHKQHLYYSGRENRTSLLSLISQENSLISHSETKPTRMSK